MRCVIKYCMQYAMLQYPNICNHTKNNFDKNKTDHGTNPRAWARASQILIDRSATPTAHPHICHLRLSKKGRKRNKKEREETKRKSKIQKPLTYRNESFKNWNQIKSWIDSSTFENFIQFKAFYLECVCVCVCVCVFVCVVVCVINS